MMKRKQWEALQAEALPKALPVAASLATRAPAPKASTRSLAVSTARSVAASTASSSTAASVVLADTPRNIRECSALANISPTMQSFRFWYRFLRDDDKKRIAKQIVKNMVENCPRDPKKMKGIER